MEFLIFNLSLGICNYLLINMLSLMDNSDPIKSMNKLYEEAEKASKQNGIDMVNFINNIIDFGQNNELLFKIIIFLALSIPILNIVLFVIYSIRFFENYKKRKNGDL